MSASQLRVPLLVAVLQRMRDAIRLNRLRVPLLYAAGRVRTGTAITSFALIGFAGLAGCSGGTDREIVGLTRDVPPLVGRACREAAAQVSIPLVCPRLVPRSRYVTATGLWGPIVYSRRLWLITFNNGDNGRGYVHWMVGAGDAGEVRYHLLGDEQNVVKGLPRLLATKKQDGRTLLDYRFPAYPAGGPNGGHAATFIPCGALFVFASVHGYARTRMAERMALDLAEQTPCA